MNKSGQAQRTIVTCPGHTARKAQQKLKCKPPDSKSDLSPRYWVRTLPGLGFLISLTELGQQREGGDSETWMQKDFGKCKALCESTHCLMFLPIFVPCQMCCRRALGPPNHPTELGGPPLNLAIINLFKHTHARTHAHALLLMQKHLRRLKDLSRKKRKKKKKKRITVLHKRDKARDLFNGIWVVQGCFGPLKGFFCSQDMKVSAMKWNLTWLLCHKK